MKRFSPMLGVLGGLGPMSTFYFCELLTKHTKASSDRDHIDMLISSRATTPDRTAFILGASPDNPLPVMQEEADRLIAGGADLLVIPCNTAHYFYDGLAAHCRVPILNIIRETVEHLHTSGVRTFGLLATEGTIASRSYHRPAEEKGMTCLSPDQKGQAVVNDAIFSAIKRGEPVDYHALSEVFSALQARGCECLILGCTELSLLDRTQLPPLSLVDALEVLAYRTILACQKEPIGFSFDLFSKTEETV